MVTPKIGQNICLAPKPSPLYRESRKIPECLEPLSLEEEYQKYQQLTEKTSTLGYVLGGASAWFGCAKVQHIGDPIDGSLSDGPDGTFDGPTDGMADRSMTEGMRDGPTDGMSDGVMVDATIDGPLPDTLKDGPMTDGIADGMTDGMTDGVMADATDGPMSDMGIDGAMSDATDGPVDVSPDAAVMPSTPECVMPSNNTLWVPYPNGVFDPMEWTTTQGANYLINLWKLPYAGADITDGALIFSGDAGSASSTAAIDSFPTLDYRTDYVWEISACSVYDPNVCASSGECRFTTTHHGLIGWWRFNEEEGDIAYDWSGYGNDGTLMGEGGLPPIRTSGIAAGGLFFDGLNDYVVVGDQDILGEMGELTVEAWTHMEAYPEVEGGLGIVSKWFQEPSAYLLRTDKTGTEPRKAFFSTDTDPTSISTNPTSISGNRVDDGVYHYLAATYDGSIQQIYMDVVLEAVSIAAQTGTINDSLSMLCFGTHCNITGPVGGFFKGKIDELAIYNRKLEPEELLANCERIDPSEVVCP